MSKIIITGLVVIAAAGLFLLGCKGMSHEQRADHIVKEVSSKLNLNDSQKTQLSSIKNELMRKGLEMRAEHERVHKDISAQIMSDRIDVDEVKTLIKKKHARFEDLIDTAVDRLAEFHATLTPEQKEQLVAWMETHRQRKLKHWHH